MTHQVRYGIEVAGDAMGGSRTNIISCTEEEARAHQNDGWSRGVKITVEDVGQN
jgi:hypothetical protein